MNITRNTTWKAFVRRYIPNRRFDALCSPNTTRPREVLSCYGPIVPRLRGSTGPVYLFLARKKRPPYRGMSVEFCYRFGL